MIFEKWKYENANREWKIHYGLMEFTIKSIDWNNLETHHLDDVYIMTAALPLIRSFQWQENDIKYLGAAHIMRKNNDGVYNFVPLRSLSNMVTRAIDPRYTAIWKEANNVVE